MSMQIHFLNTVKYVFHLWFFIFYFFGKMWVFFLSSLSWSVLNPVNLNFNTRTFTSVINTQQANSAPVWSEEETAIRGGITSRMCQREPGRVSTAERRRGERPRCHDEREPRLLSPRYAATFPPRGTRVSIARVKYFACRMVNGCCCCCCWSRPSSMTRVEACSQPRKHLPSHTMCLPHPVGVDRLFFFFFWIYVYIYIYRYIIENLISLVGNVQQHQHRPVIVRHHDALLVIVWASVQGWEKKSHWWHDDGIIAQCCHK